MDFDAYLASGQLELVQVDIGELSPGEFANQVRRMVEQKSASFIVIDSVNGFMEQIEALRARSDSEEGRRERDRQAEAQRARDREALRQKIRALRLPITAEDEEMLVLGELSDTKFLRNVRTWLTTDRPWIVLSSPTGRGKTLAAAEAIARERRRSWYMSARELERIFTARYGDEVEKQQVLIDCRGVLVLDDIGTERDPRGMGAALLALVDARRGVGHRTIATTNLSRADFQALYPEERLWSRLVECMVWMTDKGDDMRRGRGA